MALKALMATDIIRSQDLNHNRSGLFFPPRGRRRRRCRRATQKCTSVCLTCRGAHCLYRSILTLNGQTVQPLNFCQAIQFPRARAELQNTQLLDVPHLKRQYDKAYDELDNGRTNILRNRVVFKCALIYIAIFTTIWASYILRVYLTFPAEGGKHIIVMYGDRITIVHIQLEREHCSCAAPWTIFSVTFSSCFKASGEMRPLRFPLI